HCSKKPFEYLHRSLKVRRGRAIVDSVVVEGGLRVLFQGSASEPLMECRPGSRVAIVRGGIARLVETELQPDDILWMAVVEGLLPCGIDDIIGRCNDPGDVSNHQCVVRRSLKRNDFGHVESFAP